MESKSLLLKEMNMERIRILQEHKKELREEINSNIYEKNEELFSKYLKLERLFNEIICYEAKCLDDI
ncbi:hypothetical protein [Peptoniphilus catoniae]|uniref:hypothetical protein n=1 Tax=Peptoniphilus catoniae TaxID=1660341 RepID=UPI0010FD737E|nr:hypothetical protein [Peptoniphilus catoniae]